MKIYSAHGVNDFVICLGYKGYVIKEFFANYSLHTADVTLDLATNSMEVHRGRSEPWRVTLVDTGANSQTGGRLKAVREYIKSDEPFCFTYGDGLANVDVTAEIAFHRKHGRKATIMAVAPPGRFGALEFEGDAVRAFREKPAGDGGLINGGYFVLEADHAQRTVQDMHSAMATRAVIDQALGILMAQQHCTPEVAFAILRRASQNRNVKLRDIAAAIVTSVSGEPPQPPVLEVG